MTKNRKTTAGKIAKQIQVNQGNERSIEQILQEIEDMMTQDNMGQEYVAIRITKSTILIEDTDDGSFWLPKNKASQIWI